MALCLEARSVGKTSFINLAERCWERAADKVIVCRFEPLSTGDQFSGLP
jgi:hypothetical protein